MIYPILLNAKSSHQLILTLWGASEPPVGRPGHCTCIGHSTTADDRCGEFHKPRLHENPSSRVYHTCQPCSSLLANISYFWAGHTPRIGSPSWCLPSSPVPAQPAASSYAQGPKGHKPAMSCRGVIRRQLDKNQ